MVPQNPLEGISAFFLCIYLAGFVFLVGYFIYVVATSRRRVRDKEPTE